MSAPAPVDKPSDALIRLSKRKDFDGTMRTIGDDGERERVLEELLAPKHIRPGARCAHDFPVAFPAYIMCTKCLESMSAGSRYAKHLWHARARDWDLHDESAKLFGGIAVMARAAAHAALMSRETREIGEEAMADLDAGRDPQHVLHRTQALLANEFFSGRHLEALRTSMFARPRRADLDSTLQALYRSPYMLLARPPLYGPAPPHTVATGAAAAVGGAGGGAGGGDDIPPPSSTSADPTI